MGKKIKILFLQHAAMQGGSNNSLLYTLNALKSERFTPLVGLVYPSINLTKFYHDQGFTVADASNLPLFRHTTAGWGRLCSIVQTRAFIEGLFNWNGCESRLRHLLATTKADLFHLNSIILAPVALCLQNLQVNYVWHVREAPVKGYFGLRYSWLRKLLIRAGDRVIFISEADKQAWVGGSCGTVVHNFVDFHKFHPGVDPTPAQTRLGLPNEGTPTLLYLGGFAEIKGIFVLLEALHLLQKRGVPYRCLMPGCLSSYQRSGLRGKLRNLANRIGLADDTCRAKQLLHKYQLASNCHLLPFENDVPGLLALTDLLVFPSTQPHFARPVVEAAAMGKPVVASDLAGVSELVENGRTGLLVPDSNPAALADALEKLLCYPQKRAAMGQQARKMAELRFDSRKQIQKIVSLYDRITSDGQKSFARAKTDNTD